MKHIRLITFDLDNTLWESEPVIDEAERALEAWMARHHPVLTERYDRAGLKALRDAIHQEHPHLRHDVTALRRRALSRVMTEFGLPATVADEAMEVFLTARQNVILHDDVVPALERMRARFATAALTNGNADVHRIGVGHLFDAALSPADVGAAKPDPAMFLEVCNRLGVRPEETVHVGDDGPCDVAGAAAVGMRTVWIRRYRQTYNCTVEPHARVADLFELEALLDAWTAASGAV